VRCSLGAAHRISNNKIWRTTSVRPSEHDVAVPPGTSRRSTRDTVDTARYRWSPWYCCVRRPWRKQTCRRNTTWCGRKDSNLGVRSPIRCFWRSGPLWRRRDCRCQADEGRLTYPISPVAGVVAVGVGGEFVHVAGGTCTLAALCSFCCHSWVSCRANRWSFGQAGEGNGCCAVEPFTCERRQASSKRLHTEAAAEPRELSSGSLAQARACLVAARAEFHQRPLRNATHIYCSELLLHLSQASGQSTAAWMPRR
jgi:hypothetical protein